MIDNKKYNEILVEGLLLDHYFLLCNVKNGVKLVDNKRIQGFINLLTKKGYLSEGSLTEKGLKLVEDCELGAIVVVDKQTKINLAEWVLALHEKCEGRILKLTGKRQVRDKVGHRSFPFLPNPTDLSKNVHKVITLYKLKDYDKIERTIMRYIDMCHKTNSWFPVLYYYLFKEGKSQLVTDMDGVDDTEESEDQFTITKNKDLF